MQLNMHEKHQHTSKMNTRQQAAEPISKSKANKKCSPGDGGHHHLDHPAHKANRLVGFQQRVK